MGFTPPADEALVMVGAPPEPAGPAALPDLAQIKGQEAPKRALEVSAAGGHPVLLTGPAEIFSGSESDLIDGDRELG